MSPIISGFALLLTCLALPIFAYANDTMALTDEPILQFGNSTWLDDTRDDAKNWLNHTAQHVDGWFGVSDLDEPAHASIRLMLDTHYNEYDGTTVKPRIRGRIKLPTLENRLSVMIGDDKLDLEHGGGIHNDGRAITYGNNAFNRRQNREDNTSLALRWSKFQNDIGVDTDADIGLRSDDLYLKLHAQKSGILTIAFTPALSKCIATAPRANIMPYPRLNLASPNPSIAHSSIAHTYPTPIKTPKRVHGVTVCINNII